MAEVLTVVAEEMGRVFGLVWSGVGVAMRLNNQVMNTVFKVTTRIVQLLLLLTHKAADLLSLLLTDLLLFLGDIGNAVMAVGAALRTAVVLILTFINGIAISIMAAAVYSCQLVHASYMAVLSGVITAFTQLGNLVTTLKQAFVLFGSSVIFVIGFVPNVVYLVFSGLVHLCTYTFLSCSHAVTNTCHVVSHVTSLCLNNIVDFFSDIPIEAFIGVAAGVGLMVGLKYTLFFMMDNMVLIPDLPSPMALGLVRRRLVRWYMGLVNPPRQQAPPEPDTEDEELDDANDENGNDNNENVPDLNLAQNQQFEAQVNPPLVAQPEARRPLTRLRAREQEDVVPQEEEKATPSYVNKLLFQELEEERESRLCVVCQDEAKCVILLPCRHLCLCDACTLAITRRREGCPVCRQQIRQTIKVYL
ncbi:E3 ubiquitin-protein ligase RNF26 [Chionoecetes opilio]|uniref:E3 ubiquitin-protein ligase RNF26 n=1 Tax=Chionoecetes opilio TaxID=41210 RepID=A0A8J4YN93_CHIOP|nr:E3 ubiquitin-protein ligase RNF26 [Chionoecetes opilio]